MTASKKLIQASAGNVAGGDFYPYTVDNSARFDGSSYLYRTAGTATDARKGAISFWTKREKLTASQVPFISFGSPNSAYIELTVTDTFTFQDGGNNALLMTYLRRQFRDTSGWYHFLLILDSTNPVANDRDKLYINGVRETDFASGRQGNTTLNGTYQALSASSANGLSIGYSSLPLYGYLAEVALVDGTVYSETDFGEFKNGVWTPKDISGLTFGNNGFYLDFGNSAALGTDVSGNSNNFTSSGLTSSDQMPDTPTNNFATFDPLTISGGYRSVFSNGNLYASHPTTGSGMAPATIAFPGEGLFWVECRMTGTTSPRYYVQGITDRLFVNPWNDSLANQLYWYADDGYVYVNNSAAAQPGTYSSGNILGFLVDIDNQEITFYKDGISTGATVSFNAAGCRFYAGDGTSSPSYTWQSEVNFGQGGTYARGYSDANGIGNFYYQPPTDALALCTANLPEPTIGPNSATLSDENFNTVLYTGQSGAESITGVGFQPDLVWIKNRGTTNGHDLTDVLRGAGNILFSNATNAEVDNTAYFLSFDSDGFSLGLDGGDTGFSGNSYVAWNWKANGSGVSNTDGSITSTVSANQDSGFSIITYTGNGTSGATIGHGLNAVPKTIWVKDRSDTNAFTNYFESLGTGSELYFAYNQAKTNSNFWITSPTTSVFSASSSEYVNASAHTYVAYAFAEVEGFSSFGSYTGNGSSDGPFVYTGFRPAFLVIKQTDGNNSWNTSDGARTPYNGGNDSWLSLDSTNAESSSQDLYDYLSNGFKLRSNAGGVNGSGATYIYMAFAENPFKYSNAR